MAGLPSSSAWVKVGPPLLASGPSRGSVLGRSPEATLSEQLPSPSRLCPSDVIAPEQSPPEALLAMVVLVRVVSPPSLRIPPPDGELLPVTVVLVRLKEPLRI